MESILRLRSAALLVPFKRTGHPIPFACHLSRHIAFVGRIRFPRSVLRRHHRSVSCFGTAPSPLPPPPPKDGEENGKKDCVGSGRKGARVAAISVAVALACALGAVYLRRGAPVPELLRGTANIAACINQTSNIQAHNTDQGMTPIKETLYVVRAILFKDASCLIQREPTTSTLGKHRFDNEKYELTISMTLFFIAEKDFHSAKTVICKLMKEKDTEISSDARPTLLMAVIDLMLAVEATLSPEKSKEEVDVLIESAKESLEKFFKNKEKFGIEEPPLES